MFSGVICKIALQGRMAGSFFSNSKKTWDWEWQVDRERNGEAWGAVSERGDSSVTSSLKGKGSLARDDDHSEQGTLENSW